VEEGTGAQNWHWVPGVARGQCPPAEMTVPLLEVSITVVNLHVFSTWLASSMRDAGTDSKLKAYTWPSSPAEHRTLWSEENMS
jgi:hypothetical protein